MQLHSIYQTFENKTIENKKKSVEIRVWSESMISLIQVQFNVKKNFSFLRFEIERKLLCILTFRKTKIEMYQDEYMHYKPSKQFITKS